MRKKTLPSDIEAIRKVISSKYGVSYDELTAKHTKNYPLQMAVSIYTYLLRTEAKLPIKDIAAMLQIEPRAVHYRINNVDMKIKTHTFLQKEIKEIIKTIKNYRA